MNLTHLHLLIAHLPIFGTFLGLLVLTQGIITKSNLTKIAAYNIFIISAIGAGIAYFSGESAEETVENIQGISHDLVEAHEHFAKYARISAIILGVSSLVALILTIRKSSFTRIIAVLMLILSIISFSVIARTGFLGGKIRHTEINSPPSPLQSHEEYRD